MNFPSNELLRNGSGYVDPTAYAAMKTIDKEQRAMKFKRGCIYDYEVKDGVFRPTLIISCDDRAGDDKLTAIVLGDERKNEEEIGVAGYYADARMVSFVYASRFGGYICRAAADEMRDLDADIMYALGLEREEEEEQAITAAPEPRNFAVELAEAKTEARIYRELYERLSGILAGCGKA